MASLIVDFVASLATGMLRIARSAGASLRFAEALLLTPEQLQLLNPRQRALMRETGLYLRDLREIAGLTLTDLSRALDLEQQSLIEAVENGTATLSFELILRLAGLLARHDPLPFVMRAVRTYHPELWKVLENWGASQLPVQFERERQFLNLYRRYDDARRLSDRGFDEVLRFTQAAFELALHFAFERQGRSAKERIAETKERKRPAERRRPKRKD